MGRKSFTGLSILLTAALLAFSSTGCRDRSPDGGFSDRFAASGEERVRELGIYSGTERVGDIRIARVSGNWGGGVRVIRLTEEVQLRLSFRSDRFLVSSSQVSYVGSDLDLVAAVGTMDFGAGSWETRVTRVGEGVYEREQVTAGSRTRDRISVPEGLILSETLPLYIERFPAEQSEKVNLGVFNMTLGQEFPLTIEYRGPTRYGKLYAVAFWGMEEKIWLDDSGMVAREEMALGVSARPPGEKDTAGHLPLETVLSQSAVPGLQIPGDLGERDETVLVLEGSLRPPPEGRWQTVVEGKGGTLVKLTRPAVPAGDNRQPDADQMPADTFGLDLDSPRIRELSRSITGSEEDPWKKALAIGRWVNRELGKSMRECFSALQVLETGEGECQSHSLLTVSLCRAAGLPARFVYGVVYLPDREVFGFHTWVEVHVGEWIPVDPTLGNFPAGVDHLTLAVGGYQDQFRLFPYIMGQGGWRIKMKDAENRTQDTG